MFCIIIIFCCFLTCVHTVNTDRICKAEPTDTEIEEALTKQTEQQIKALDTSKLEETFENINFTNESFSDFLNEIISGNLPLNFESILNLIKTYFTANLNEFISFAISIILICFLSSLFNNLQSDKASRGMGDTVSIFFLVVLISIISYRVIDSINESVGVVNKIGSVLNSAFPIILALLVSMGATQTSVIFKPSVVVFTNVILKIFSSVITTLIIAYFICTCLGNISSNFKLNKIKTFIASLMKTIIGIVFTIFMAFLSIKGITSATADGISIKTTKYAIKSYVPIVGGYISDGFEIFKAGSLLVKNSIGIVCLLIIFFVCFKLVINLILMNLCLKLASGISEPFSSPNLNNFISGVSDVYKYLLATILVVFMMSFIFVILLILSATNIF